MHRSTTRRDFLNGVSVATGGHNGSAAADAEELLQPSMVGVKSDPRYPPTLT